MPQFDYLQPLCKKGIVAGKYHVKKTLILDCAAQHGNSGGAVVSFDGFTGETKLIGVVSQLIPYIEHNLYSDSTGQPVSGVITSVNSSYSVIVSMDFVLQLISEFQEALKKKIM